MNKYKKVHSEIVQRCAELFRWKDTPPLLPQKQIVRAVTAQLKMDEQLKDIGGWGRSGIVRELLELKGIVG